MSTIQSARGATLQASTLADVLDRVLDKGVVIAGDINISLVGVELLNIKIRLLIASVDKAREIGINWWESDPYLSSRPHIAALESRVAELETELAKRDQSAERS